MGAELLGDVVFSEAWFGTISAFGTRFGQNVLFGGAYQTLPTTFSGDVVMVQATAQKSISFRSASPGW